MTHDGWNLYTYLCMLHLRTNTGTLVGLGVADYLVVVSIGMFERSVKRLVERTRLSVDTYSVMSTAQNREYIDACFVYGKARDGVN